VRFVVDKMALWQVFLPILRFSSVSDISPMLQANFFLNTTLNRRTHRRRSGIWNTQKIIALSEGRENGKHCIKSIFTFVGAELRDTLQNGDSYAAVACSKTEGMN
jgi:hypothetical protein